MCFSEIGLVNKMVGVGDGVFHGLKQNEKEVLIGVVEVLELVVLEDVGEVQFKVLEFETEVLNFCL